MSNDAPKMFPKIGSTTQLWNDAIEAAAVVAESYAAHPIAAKIRQLKKDA